MNHTELNTALTALLDAIGDDYGYDLRNTAHGCFCEVIDHDGGVIVSAHAGNLPAAIREALRLFAGRTNA